MFRAILACAISSAALLLAAGAGPAANRSEELKTAIGKALPLLWKGALGHVAQRTCFACHNQGIPILAFTTARERGFPIRDEDLKKQLEFVAAFLEGNRDNYRQGKGQGGGVDTAGYALLALELGGWQPDATTEAVVEYLLLQDKKLDHWRTTSNRPPSEASEFTANYLAIRALGRWGKPAHKDRIAKRIDTVRGWLLKAPVRDTEDRVFCLWSLQAAGAEDKDLRPAVQALVSTQRKDGGWSQTKALESDAYATGSVLVALHQAGRMPTSDPVYQAGVAFLLKSQQGDGSWLVHSRSKPFQTYYESGFPHGKDQFISMAASAWATTALALAYPAKGRIGQSSKGQSPFAGTLESADLEGQPLAANVKRLLQALEYLGAPLPAETSAALKVAAEARDARKLQQLLDPHVLLVVSLNPESRVKVARAQAPAILQQAGFTPVLVKVVNDSTVTESLRIQSPQSGPVYAGVATLSMTRQDQLPLTDNENTRRDQDRFLAVEMFTSQLMTPKLSGLKTEYAIALIYSSEAGKREATISFDVGQGSQDLGFRSEAPVLFDVRPAVPVKLSIKDDDGQASCGRFTFRDKTGHVYPPQAKRLAPDLFFQQHIYRADGGIVLLPPGEFIMQYSRGPEYRLLERKITIPAKGEAHLAVRLERWVNPAEYGYYSGDHHIHAAGCAHYTVPTEGVLGRDMFLQVKGEGLNVGCILTWGPCFQYQHQFFEPTPSKLSEPFTVVKYDIEVSGFGSQALGHVCLLNLRDQNYPGSDGIKNWPTWTTPVLRWAKQQGAFTGYAHSASGLQINPAAAARRLLAGLDADRDGKLNPQEAAKGLLPEEFAAIDADRDGFLTEAELAASLNRVADRLPNLAIPELNSVGAQEIFVTVPQGLCDFISAMDTARVAEWNCWYHLMNCGFPLKVSGETDFPCMSGTRVGQGRVYVQLGKIDHIDFRAWCEGLARGRSYVSDGYAHALEFTVAGKPAGSEVALAKGGTVTVKAKVAFAAETPEGVPYGTVMPAGGNRLVGDTVDLHGPRPSDEARPRGGKRLVELIVNGRVTASREVPADDQPHDLTFSVKIDRSSWIAIRHFPQMHTNPVSVIVAGEPIRASRQSARWCIDCIEQLWRVRGKTIAPAERDEAHKTFQEAIKVYRRIAAQAPEGS